ncbi:hypothetical protein AQJ91_27380 [Streptomyces dysideae]|uniref:Uncharacterized protein n=1 Tax=Streptomyces dysideae TaxID=909626 RepID=A0A101UWF1_9ACTN|nr:hypothetical protein AQJ91_27380 [Streptomyces dysideae]
MVGFSRELLELGAHGFGQCLGGGERAHHHREVVDPAVFVEVPDVAPLELLAGDGDGDGDGDGGGGGEDEGVVAAVITLTGYGVKATGLVKTTSSAGRAATASMSPLSTTSRNGCMRHLFRAQQIE